MTLTPPRTTDTAPRPALDAFDRARRGVTLALGLIWLLDAALQYQPYMFTKAFPDEVIKPVGVGSPAWVNRPDHWAGALMAHHIVFWNALFATGQLLIAAGLFFRRTTRATLAASVVWSLLIWWLGEGLGGVLAGPVSPLLGLPGAVLIYAVIAILVWPPRAGVASSQRRRPSRSIAEAGPIGGSAARIVWLVFWAAFVFESLRPTDRAPNALGGIVAGMADGEPHWLASLDRWASQAIVGDGTQASIVLALVFAALGLCVFVPKGRLPVLVIGIVLSLALWLVAEDLGEIATGTATDCNSGPLLVLLMICYWPFRISPRERADEARDSVA